jgi:predicted HTH domain antitoxin
MIELGKLGLSQAYIKEALITVLYHEGKISSEKACDLLGVARREFEGGIVQRHGYATYGNTHADVDLEINASLR